MPKYREIPTQGIIVWGCFSGLGPGPVVPMKGTVDGSAYQDILDKFMLPTLWQPFGDDLILLQHDCTPLNKARSI